MTSMCWVPGKGSPPIPTVSDCPRPARVVWLGLSACVRRISSCLVSDCAPPTQTQGRAHSAQKKGCHRDRGTPRLRSHVRGENRSMPPRYSLDSLVGEGS